MSSTTDTLKKLVAGIAPGLATVFGGPLAGSAVAILADKVLGGSSGNKDLDEVNLVDAMKGGITPEVRAAIVAADKEVRLAVIAAGVRERELDVEVDKAVLADTANARQHGAGNGDLLTLGVIILVVWAVLTGATLYGLFALLTGEVKIVDVGVVATIFTVLGSTIGYVSGIAQQVVSFFFGSSRGSLAKTNVLGEAIVAQARPK